MEIKFKQTKWGFGGSLRAGKTTLENMPTEDLKEYIRKNLETPKGRVFLSQIFDHSIEELTEFAGSKPEKPIRKPKKTEEN